MFGPPKKKVQPPLPFACASCLYYGTGRCAGPGDIKTYNMRGSAMVSCVEEERRQVLFEDLYSQLPPTPKQSHQDQIILPAFIPGITNAFTESLSFPLGGLFAVSLETLVGDRGTLLCDSAESLRHKLHLPAGSRFALIGTAKDYKIERLWTNSAQTRIWQRIADFGFDFVTSITYSVYDERPRADQVFNQDRTLVTHDYFANLGVPSIPFLYPYNDEDYRAAFEWLQERPDISKVAVLAQFYRTDRQFSYFLQNMRAIRDGMNRPLEFLVVGAGTYNKIAAIMLEFDATIVTAKPFHKASAGLRTMENLEHPEEDEIRHSFTNAELAVQNVNQFSSVCFPLEEKRKNELGRKVIPGCNLLPADAGSDSHELSDSSRYPS